MDVLLTVDDLAKRWGLAKQTIYNRISRGAPMPPSMRLDNHGPRRFRLKDVETYEETRIYSTSIEGGS
jgi:predicted DNA-binding transcriptional regulator AlpA